ncbi:hypothetical protein WICMUC_002419 [Wickerhamomyces mucosus]|uniref:Transcription factor TFIIIC triple barrel domain-containing protein n=1 Tax=Wickerhamomyces mucosus TaxID=1378264 RepID=A0A9P8PR79_9ASCO|nr:hypothetical protein WICMUC_002419 [Wickerhamomyces mucosus]
MVMQLYKSYIYMIIIHGYRANWLPEPHPPTPTGIDSDPALAPHGEDQAQELANYIFSIDSQPEIIFSSPFYRCIQTSLPISKILDIDILLENGIGEWFKPDRPIKPKPATFDQLVEFFPENLKNYWDPILIPSIEGETPEQIFQRCQNFWSIFIENFELKFPNLENVLFVTHAATKIALGSSLLGLNSVYEKIDNDENISLRAGTCSLDKYIRLKDGENWKIVMNGNVEFLTSGEEMNWDFANGFEAGSDEDIKNRKSKEIGLKGKNDNNSSINDNNNSTTNEDYKDVFVTLDLPQNNFTTGEIPATSKLQISGLHSKTPLFKINDEIYQGDWQKMVGTDVTFDENLDEFIIVKDRIKLEDVTPN